MRHNVYEVALAQPMEVCQVSWWKYVGLNVGSMSGQSVGSVSGQLLEVCQISF